ncbi:MAG: tRNA (adenosine(37)-N6)-dimethylallyltransferase MiaA [Acholeplasmataceae bacterium]|nr:tRNA (adenosine(37)-N6)-dimethylallyltransferase MiaA [Acholeplasmataceae bacterium]
MKPIIAICGPTASKKSHVAIAIAKRFPSEIISADAFQIYRGMDIGTAKMRPEETKGVPHHLIDILDPVDSCSVHDYQSLARQKISEIRKRGNTPIIVGGSGLYLQAVLYDYRFEGKKRLLDDDDVTLSNADLQNRLREINPILADTIHQNNRRRLIRALEIAKSSKEANVKTNAVPFYQNLVLIGLSPPRERLYEAINNRVDKMIEAGLLEEVKRLSASGLGTQAAQAIGYKELIAHLEGRCTLESAVENIKQNTRRYAKRQLTWFKNQMSLQWFDVNPDDLEGTIRSVMDYINEKAKP